MLPACLQVFGCVNMRDFLAALAARRLKPNATSMDIYRRLYAPPPEVAPSPAGSPLQTKVGVRMRATAADGSCLKSGIADRLSANPSQFLRERLLESPRLRHRPPRDPFTTSGGYCTWRVGQIK